MFRESILFRQKYFLVEYFIKEFRKWLSILRLDRSYINHSLSLL